MKVRHVVIISVSYENRKLPNRRVKLYLFMKCGCCCCCCCLFFNISSQSKYSHIGCTAKHALLLRKHFKVENQIHTCRTDGTYICLWVGEGTATGDFKPDRGNCLPKIGGFGNCFARIRQTLAGKRHCPYWKTRRTKRR